MNGIEQILFNLLQGFGIDPQDLMRKAQHLMNVTETKLNSIDERLARIENALGIINEHTAEYPTLKSITQENKAEFTDESEQRDFSES